MKADYRAGIFAGFSFGLFLDQRENRFRFPQNRIAPGFPNKVRKPPLALNAFAYTCGFFVCAGLAVAKVSSVDLSRKHLDWERSELCVQRLESQGTRIPARRRLRLVSAVAKTRAAL